ncbi:17142_t:CDS:2 [Entrophospora sp. SA101]|nr:17142_t:CDS:2 [Entrophospora sp. SA101]CAJ0829227.1 20447_t:CDS:2 [Entrophospora sp. SA101]CAJ0907663.1 14165_t:CDS:2 [Entrophospora sp. SA101]
MINIVLNGSFTKAATDASKLEKWFDDNAEDIENVKDVELNQNPI